MISIERRAYRVMWALIGLLLAAGWVVYGMAASGNRTFLIVMVVLSILLAGGAAILLRPRPGA